MSTLSNSRSLNISNGNKDSSSLFNKVKSMDCMSYRSDVVDNEENIPNIFITPQFNKSNGVLFSSSSLETEKDTFKIFNVPKYQVDSTNTSNYTERFCEYPNLFTLHESHSEPYNFKDNSWTKFSDYSNVFSLSHIQQFDCVQHLEINNRNNAKQENTISITNDKLLHKSSFKENSINISKLDTSESKTINKYSILEDNSEEKMSSALCFWCIVTGANVRDHNIKTYFPQKEISSTCIMHDIKLMLINMGTNYFAVDEDTHMYKQNGNISMIGLTPEMFESATNSIIECSNLYKMLRSTLTKWKDISNDSIVKAFIFAVSNILDDYERMIYSISNESLLSLVCRLSRITPQLRFLANICFLKIHSYVDIQECMPTGVKLLNKIHSYLYDYRFPRDSFLKMLLYIFELCCLAYFRILSNWALKGVLEENKIGMFIQSKFDIKDEDLNSRGNWNRFIVDESIEVPIFLEKYKNNILQCGKTINFYNQFNNLNVFLPDLTCCFDALDTQRVYEQFITYYKYDSSLKTTNCIKQMPNCYLFESVLEPIRPKYNIDSDDIQTTKLPDVTENINIHSNSENYELFQIPDWTFVDNTYDFNKPFGFFLDNNDVLMYNGKPFDVISMIDYVPHSILIPARIQMNVCDKQILNLFFIQENLMGRLYYLSQCFFLMSRKFSFKLCETLFDGIITNREKPLNIFNPVTLKSIVDEAIQDSFSMNEQHNFTLEVTFIPRLKGKIDISDVECIELNYSPVWPIDMILSDKVLLKYRRIFMFAIKLEYVSWSLFKAREILSVHKNDTGLQFRKINIFKHCMNQFVSSIQQYYKQVVVGTCWSELNENFEYAQNYDDLFVSHKQYMHQMLRRCLMVVGLKDKLILLNKIYIEILAYYQALAGGQFYMKNSEWVHSEFINMEQSFSRFVKLREMFYTSVLKTVQTNAKHYVVQLESLIAILGPSYNDTI